MIRVREKLSSMVKHAVIGRGQSGEVYECKHCGVSLRERREECPECGSATVVQYSFV